MSLVLGSNYAAPAHTPTTPSAHKRSTSTASIASMSSITSNTSGTFDGGSSLRERRGVTFRLSFSGLPAEVEILTPKGYLEPRFDNVPRRRRALPTPISVFKCGSAMGKADVNSSVRDFGMADDGWTVAF